MVDRVKDKVALVTGARRGLGAAIAAMLAREGAKVVLTDRKADGSEEVMKQIADDGGEVIFLEHDVSAPEDWDRVISETVTRFDKASILVNNAGVGAGMDIEAVTSKGHAANWRRATRSAIWASPTTWPMRCSTSHPTSPSSPPERSW